MRLREFHYYSNNYILEEQAKVFRQLRGDDGKLMKSFECSVDILYMLSITTVLGEGIGLVRPKLIIGVHCSWSLFRHSHLQKQYLLGLPSYSPYVSLRFL
jgi:hypothetical protein